MDGDYAIISLGLAPGGRPLWSPLRFVNTPWQALAYNLQESQSPQGDFVLAAREFIRWAQLTDSPGLIAEKENGFVEANS